MRSRVVSPKNVRAIMGSALLVALSGCLVPVDAEVDQTESAAVGATGLPGTMWSRHVDNCYEEYSFRRDATFVKRVSCDFGDGRQYVQQEEGTYMQASAAVPTVQNHATGQLALQMLKSSCSRPLFLHRNSLQETGTYHFVAGNKAKGRPTQLVWTLTVDGSDPHAFQPIARFTLSGSKFACYDSSSEGGIVISDLQPL